MKSQNIVDTNGRARRMTRAERRAAERAAEHERVRERAQRKGGISTTSLVGGLLTVAVVLAAVVYGLVRSYAVQNSATGTGGGVADPSALNEGGAQPKVGQLAPNFTLKDTIGMPYSLKEERGHPVLLEFFAVWCPVCEAEAPTIAKLTKNYVPKGVTVLSVLANPYGPNYEASGRSDLTLATVSDLRSYAHEFNVRHPQLIDPKFVATNEYGVNAYPGLYVIDSKGIIRFAGSGARQYRDISKVLDSTLRSAGLG